MLTGSSQCRSAPLNPKHCQRQSFRESRQVPQQVNFYHWSEDAQICPSKAFQSMIDCSSYTRFMRSKLNSATRTSSLSEKPVVLPNRNWLHVFFGLDKHNGIGQKFQNLSHPLPAYSSPLSMYPLIDIPYFLVHF